MSCFDTAAVVMANTKYYLAENYKHYHYGFIPSKKELDKFPVCPWCGADICVDSIKRDWACSNSGCRLS